MIKKLMNIAIFASGRGTNFSAIARAVKRGYLKANLSLVVCDNLKAGVISRAKKSGIKVFLSIREDFPSKKDFEQSIIDKIKQENISLICLAGFMRILSLRFIKKYKGRIINIHPSLLPYFKGNQAIKDALTEGAKITGVTVHFVDELVDHGPVILQEKVKIQEGETLKSLEEKIHRVEHKLYPRAIRLFLENRLSPNNILSQHNTLLGK